MLKKSFSILVLTLILGAGVFVWLQVKPQSDPVVSSTPITSEPAETPTDFHSVSGSAPTFEEMVRQKVNDTQFSKTELYISENNMFSVRIPIGTKVTESNEGGYVLTYFRFKDSVHAIMVSSHRGDVNESNLQEVIAIGKEGHLLTGGFKTENRVKCGDSSAICFLTMMYSQPTGEYPTPQLMRLVENIISQNQFSRYYSFDMGAHYPQLTTKEIALFKQFHESFRLLR